MVDTNSLVNMSDITSGLWQSMQPSLAPLITIFKAIGIAILVYIIFLIIRALFRWKSAIDIGKIAKNVEEINNKLDLLLGKRSAKIEEKTNDKKIKKEKKKK